MRSPRFNFIFPDLGLSGIIDPAPPRVSGLTSKSIIGVVG